jgi:hypothetical protein
MRHHPLTGLFLLFNILICRGEVNAGTVPSCPTTDPALARTWSELNWSKPDRDAYERELEVFSEGLKRLEAEFPYYDLSRCLLEVLDDLGDVAERDCPYAEVLSGACRSRAIRDRLGREIAGHYERSSAKGATAPVVPGSPTVPGLDEKALQMVDIYISTCGWNLTAEALDPLVLARLADRTRRLTPECRSDLRRKYEQILSESRMSVAACSLRAESCAQHRVGAQKVRELLNAAQVILIQSGRPEACPQDQTDAIATPLLEIADISACVLPEVGGPPEKLVDFPQVSATGPANYLLERPMALGYRATVRLEFFKPDGRVIPGDQWRKRAQDCLDEAKPYLRGPQGETLEVILHDGSSLPTPKVNPVRIRWAGHQDDHRNWGSDIHCSDVVHEVLHLLGVTDVYQQKGLDCRVVALGEGAMGVTQRALKLARKGKQASILFPAEFRAITMPGCRVMNAAYYRCAELSYKTSCDPELLRRCSEKGDAWLGVD